MNEIFSNINWLAVLVATVAYFVLGAIWHSKAVFANKWAQGHGINMNDPNGRKGFGQILFLSFIAFFVICLTQAIIIHKMHLTGGVMSGLKVGLLTGIGFSWMTISISHLYTKKPIYLHIIDGLYHTVGQVISAIILCMWTK
jgi:hypothetical protein